MVKDMWTRIVKIFLFCILLFKSDVKGNDSDLFVLKGDINDKNKNTIPYIMMVIGKSGSSFLCRRIQHRK
jgi:hypothetical protein